MKRFEIIGINDPRWSSTISLSREYDSYHTNSYSRLEMLNKSGEPYLFVAYLNDDYIAMPLVLRKIKQTEYYDCTSVYGYCGPVSNLPIDSIPADLIIFFQNELRQFFIESNVVSAFSRLHPLMDQSVFFTDFGVIKSINTTVSIDLTIPEEKQLKQFRKSCKYEINQIRKKGYIVSEGSTESEINTFTEMYYDKMKSLKVDQFYFFSKEYFTNLLHNGNFRSILLLAKIKDEITAGAIFTMTNRFMQYHLAVSKQEFRKDSPMKLILDEARKLGINNNMKHLHLGGGVNGKSNDSLFKFKSGFSEIRHEFKVWQYITDEKKYWHLADLFEIDLKQEHKYFPVYRVKKT